jgi:hypothetical protein
MLRLARNADLRQQYSQRGREFARSSFHIDVVSRRYEQLYLSLLEQKGVSIGHP